MASPFWNIVWQFLTKPNKVLSYNLGIVLLDSSDLKIYAHIKTCMWVFTAALIHNHSNPEATRMFFNIYE